MRTGASLLAVSTLLLLAGATTAHAQQTTGPTNPATGSGGVDQAMPIDQDVAPPSPPPDVTVETDGDADQSTTDHRIGREDAPPPPPPPSPQAGDDEAPPPVDAGARTEQPIGHGTRLVLQLQTNAQVGELLNTPSTSGGFAFDRATLTGVPDALVALRLDRLTLGIGLTWTQISQPQMFTDSCTGSAVRRDLEDRSTLFGVLPTARYDVLTTNDGRGRIEAGVTPVLLFSSRSREMFARCTGSGDAMITSQDTTDTILGFDALLGGRYHIWPALTIGAELGFAYLVFDFDADPVTGDPPSVRAFTFYSALTLALELPL